MKRQCKDIKKIMRMKWKLLIFTKDVTRQRQPPRAPRSRYHFFLREQLDEMAGEDRKKYRSIVSRSWKEIKEDPARLSEYNDRVRQMLNEAEEPNDESQNEKTMVDRSTAKHFKKVPKSPKPVDTDSDNSDDEQEPVVEQPKKVPKTPEFVDADSDDSGDEQEPVVEQLQKASKISEYSDNEQRLAVNYQRCIVMYSTDDEQVSVIKQPQKA